MLKSLLLLLAVVTQPSVGPFHPAEDMKDDRPDLLVTYPITAEEGDKIVFTAKSEQAQTVDFTVIYNGNYDESIYEVLCDRYCVTQSVAGKYIVVVKAIGKTGLVTSQICPMTVFKRGIKPDPDPDDDVDPPKPIVVPPGYLGLTKWAYDEAKVLGLTQVDVSKVSKNLIAVSTVNYNSVDELNTDLKYRGNILGPDGTTGITDKGRLFDAVFIKKMVELFKAKQVDNVTDHKSAYKAIGEGLSYVK